MKKETRRESMLPTYTKVSRRLLTHPEVKLKQAFDEAGLTIPKDYAHFWLFHERNKLLQANATIHPTPPNPSLVQKYRDRGESWGLIMVRFDPDSPYGATEASVRRAYTQKTNIHHEGTRIGRGGRFLGGTDYAEALYRGANPDGSAKMQVGTPAEADKAWQDVVAAILEERKAQATLRRATTPKQKAEAQTRLARAKATTRQAKAKAPNAAPAPTTKPRRVAKATPKKTPQAA